MQLLNLTTIEEYKDYFIKKYCNQEIYTHDKLRVKFYPDQFEHAFYESENRKKRDKSIFSYERAKRMPWIRSVLEDKEAQMYIGWDRDKKKYNEDRRISIITPENYVVVLNIIAEDKAKFITAYVASKTNAQKIRSAPKWKKMDTDYWFSIRNL